MIYLAFDRGMTNTNWFLHHWNETIKPLNVHVIIYITKLFSFHSSSLSASSSLSLSITSTPNSKHTFPQTLPTIHPLPPTADWELLNGFVLHFKIIFLFGMRVRLNWLLSVFNHTVIKPYWLMDWLIDKTAKNATRQRWSSPKLDYLIRRRIAQEQSRLMLQSSAAKQHILSSTHNSWQITDNKTRSQTVIQSSANKWQQNMAINNKSRRL